MNSWSMRTPEIAFLFNPAFCGRLLYVTIKTYNEQTDASFPIPLIYLVLPLVLHKETRKLIDSRTQLHLWIQKYPHLLIDFPGRTKGLVEITNESLEFLLQTKLIYVTSNGKLKLNKTSKKISEGKFVDDEISECVRKSKQIGKWFAKAGKVETIFIELGVRP